MKKNTKRFTIELTPEDEGALAILAGREPFNTLASGNASIIRFALRSLAKQDQTSLLPATKEDVSKLATSGAVEEVRALLMGLTITSRASTETPQRGRPRQDSAAQATRSSPLEAATEKGALLCSALGGTVINGSCNYRKYEVTAGGRAVDWAITEPLTSLTEADVQNQYSPSREAYEAKLAESGA